MQKGTSTIHTIFRCAYGTSNRALCTNARIAKYPHIVDKVNLAWHLVKEQRANPYLITFIDEDIRKIHNPHK